MKTSLSPLVLAAGLLLAATTTHAQDAPIMALDPTLMAGWTGNVGNAMVHPSTAGASRPAAKAATASFAYTATPALQQQTVATAAKRLQATDAAAAKELTAAFAPGKSDYAALYRGMLKDTGLRENDAADALACYLVTGYQIVSGLTGDHDISPAQNRGARAQVAAVLAGNPQLGTAAARAQLGEEFKLQTVLLGSAWVGAVKAGTQAAYRESVVALFKNQYQMDMTQMQLTAQGFTKK
ncbi:hypothetical protein [Hymenobacter ruricola]|uniref:Uncharacterized protein n=1 Tax=Hymenobacter ruricola TaxID=2791023 RepID=A0ABS0I323_9BACT|nr:hypothetical protein [Hymenobacter ruricola]MBF9221314.1 hypothetical protein [Hymenobacter ruricola]